MKLPSPEEIANLQKELPEFLSEKLTPALLLVQGVAQNPNIFIPFVKSGIEILNTLFGELEAPLKKVLIEKSVAMTKEKFEAFKSAGFSEQQAFLLLLNDKFMLQKAWETLQGNPYSGKGKKS